MAAQESEHRSGRSSRSSIVSQRMQAPCTHRHLGIGEFTSPSRLATDFWEEAHDPFFDPVALNPSSTAEHDFPGEVVCKAIVNLSADDIARLFLDVGAPQSVTP